MLLKIKVFPNSKKQKIVQKREDSFDIFVKSKPEKGQANKEVTEILTSFFDIKDIKLLKGAKTRNKIFEINQLDKAVKILKQGGIIVYPTDTVYGVGCNVFDEKAVKKLLEIKNRGRNPLSVAVSNIEMIEKVAFIKERDFIKKLLPGPFTFVLKKKPIVSDLITAGLDTVGVRIPDNKFVLEMIKKAGFPVIATSANKSGQESATSPEQVDLKVDFVVKGECKHKKPSTVFDLEKKIIIRQGAGRIPNNYVKN